MKAVIVHRWGGSQKADWYPWLKRELEKRNWNVLIPRMPNTSEPEIAAWVNHLKKSVRNVDEETYFIGHSIGCQAIMRYLMKLPPKNKIGGMVFIAGWLKLRNLENEEVKNVARPWLETPISFEKVKEKTNKITSILSDNDSFVDYEENKNMFEKRLKAKIILEKGKGHFIAEDGVTKVPEVVKELEKMVKRQNFS